MIFLILKNQLNQKTSAAITKLRPNHDTHLIFIFFFGTTKQTLFLIKYSTKSPDSIALNAAALAPSKAP
ncbi:MAG: hypothetical protein SFU25_06895 [Candidatus Caenarcaniphilales bacterium]|nr:hypothetical protein [Candidatus Caenarcaniphilales bacterium]